MTYRFGSVILTILFFLRTGTALAQADPLEYYRLVNKAELSLVDKDVPQASQYYEKAFGINPDKPFSRDLYNAFHAAMDCRQYERAERYLARLLARGLSAGFIHNRITGFYDTTGERQIKAFLARHPNDTLHDNEMNRAIRPLLITDQGVRRYYMDKGLSNYMTDSVYRTDRFNGRKLCQYFRQWGMVPNEDMVGNGSNIPFGRMDYQMIILHYDGLYQHNMHEALFDTLIYKAIFSYDYHPDWFVQDFSQVQYSHKDSALVYGEEQIVFPLTVPAYSYYRKIEDMDNTIDYPMYFSPDREKKIDENRKKIGLCSLDEMRKKFLFYGRQRRSSGTFQKYYLNYGINPCFMTNSKKMIRPLLKEMKTRGIQF
jgi:tetratricopeptide (TPR) repeat protein